MFIPPSTPYLSGASFPKRKKEAPWQIKKDKTETFLYLICFIGHIHKVKPCRFSIISEESM
jgi:hypothetical protein